jgi:methylated-DNA-[protein]-cysteine S-methyltransferase
VNAYGFYINKVENCAISKYCTGFLPDCSRTIRSIETDGQGARQLGRLIESKEVDELNESSDNIVQFFSPPIGWMQLRASQIGIQSIVFLKGKGNGPIKTANPILLKLMGELEEYFQGKRKFFDTRVYLPSNNPFQLKVWQALRTIPWGETRSYKCVAEMIGKPGAARAVGGANKRNPLPIIVPCHRVIKADGALGGYNSGPERKRILLELEGGKIQPVEQQYVGCK